MLDRLTADSRIIDINRDCIVTSNAEGWGIRRFNYPRSLALVRGGGEGSREDSFAPFLFQKKACRGESHGSRGAACPFRV